LVFNVFYTGNPTWLCGYISIIARDSTCQYNASISPVEPLGFQWRFRVRVFRLLFGFILDFSRREACFCVFHSVFAVFGEFFYVFLSDCFIRLYWVVYVRAMAPRVRIEDTLPSGEKIVITIEGSNLSEKRVLQVLELLKIMTAAEERREVATSLKEEIWRVIEEEYGDGTWFTLRDAYDAVRARLGDVKITLMGSYLSRYVAEGRLIKKGSKPRTEYRVRLVYARKR